MAQGPIIDQEFLEKLERLTLHWQKSFPGLVGGRNPSRFAGPGQEFLDHRHFHHGDDLRAVNWRAYLRLEKLFLKMFQVEPRIPVRLLIDCQRVDGHGIADEVRLRANSWRRRLLCRAGAARYHLHPAVRGTRSTRRICAPADGTGSCRRCNYLSALEPAARPTICSRARLRSARIRSEGW